MTSIMIALQNRSISQMQSCGFHGRFIAKVLLYIDFLRGHPDITAKPDLFVIDKLVSLACASKISPMALEIGSWRGCSSVVLGRAVKNAEGKLFCCDTWRGTPGTRLEKIATYFNVFNSFCRRIKKEGLDRTVVVLQGKSEEVLPALRDSSFDFIYIDGDHSYDGVLDDIRHAKRLVKTGGIIAGHDYNAFHSQVIQAVNDVFGKPCNEQQVWWVQC